MEKTSTLNCPRRLMKIKIEKGYISIVSPKLVWFCGLWSGSPKLARAVAFFPFIIFRSEDEKVPWVIRHERIHFRQQLETVFVGLLVWSFLETLYARFILGKSFKEAYLWRSSEQEAYRNQQDQEYLTNRPLWAQFKYIKDKRTFAFGRPGEIIFTDDKIGLKRGTVVLKKHHAEWTEAFEAEKEFLKKLLGNVVIDIQHIGSTAVFGLAAKPIIDMLMGVQSLSDVTHIHPLLENAGYEYRENGSDDTQVLFVKGPEELRTHYLHITEFESPVWNNDLAFRNYLRTHPNTAQEYEKLKERLASQYTESRKDYTTGKKEFIQSILNTATETVSFVKTEDVSEKIETLFASEKKKLRGLFPNADVEHVGGTSVPGSITKGDLDINVRVKPEEFEKVVEILKGLYEINQPDNWDAGFASFKDDAQDLGIQVTVIGSPDDCFTAQRDYLRDHPEKVAELNALKKRFEGKSMDEYRKEKGVFFEKLEL